MAGKAVTDEKRGCRRFLLHPLFSSGISVNQRTGRSRSREKGAFCIKNPGGYEHPLWEKIVRRITEKRDIGTL